MYGALRADGETGNMWTERTFNHVTETDQLVECNVDADRILCFFFIGRRLILTHGFRKRGDTTPPRELERAEFCKQDCEGRVTHDT